MMLTGWGSAQRSWADNIHNMELRTYSGLDTFPTVLFLLGEEELGIGLGTGADPGSPMRAPPSGGEICGQHQTFNIPPWHPTYVALY